jgi:hypothetical protein
MSFLYLFHSNPRSDNSQGVDVLIATTVKADDNLYCPTRSNT